MTKTKWRVLTRREQEVIEVLRRMPFAHNKEIAVAMNLSVSSVKGHMKGIFETLGINSRHVLVDWIRHGL